MANPDASPAVVARELMILNSALEKLQHNLDAQYEDFFSAQVAFRLSKLTTEELERYVDVLRDDGVQGFLTKMRSLHPELVSSVNQTAEKMIRIALIGTDPAPSPALHASRSAGDDALVGG